MNTFPVLDSGGQSIPWEAIEPHREQAQKNHYQSLEQLAGRGGLTCRELYYVLTDTRLPRATHEQVDYKGLVLGLTGTQEA